MLGEQNFLPSALGISAVKAGSELWADIVVRLDGREWFEARINATRECVRRSLYIYYGFMGRMFELAHCLFCACGIGVSDSEVCVVWFYFGIDMLHVSILSGVRCGDGEGVIVEISIWVEGAGWEVIS